MRRVNRRAETRFPARRHPALPGTQGKYGRLPEAGEWSLVFGQRAHHSELPMSTFWHNKGRIHLALCACASVILAVSCRRGQAAKPPAPVAPDTTVIAHYFVIPAERDRFEGFLRNSYWPALDSLVGSESVPANARARLKVLAPVDVGSTGFLEYLFVMDAQLARTLPQFRELIEAVFKRDAPERLREYRVSQGKDRLDTRHVDARSRGRSS